MKKQLVLLSITSAIFFSASAFADNIKPPALSVADDAKPTALAVVDDAKPATSTIMDIALSDAALSDVTAGWNPWGWASERRPSWGSYGSGRRGGSCSFRSVCHK